MSSKGSVTVGKKVANKRSRNEEDPVTERKVTSDDHVSTGGESEEEDDELDLADVSSASEKESDDGSVEGAESAEEEEEDDDFPKKKKSKKSKHDDGSADFSSAVTAILSSHLKAYDRKDPILARNKKVLKKNESDKLESKARKALATEKKKLLNKTRKKDILPIVSADNENGEEIRKVIEKETKLRKIAQKGVVKLFNAILSTQVKTEKEVSTSLGGVKNKQEREQLITEVSKEKFFDLVKAAAED